MKRSVVISLGLGVLMVLGACAKRQTVRPDASAGQQQYPPTQQEMSKDEPSIRHSDWQGVAELKTVYFDFDSKSITPQAAQVLQSNAEYIKNNPELDILVEGNCDARGTTEYNLALGQQRANAVREYYGKLGIPLARIGTISYGEEKPVNPASTEAAWQQNRRADTKARTRSTIGKADRDTPETSRLD